MHGYKYHYVADPAKGILTIRPHWSTYVKAQLPALVVAGGAWMMFTVLNAKANDEMDNFLQSLPDETESKD